MQKDKWKVTSNREIELYTEVSGLAGYVKVETSCLNIIWFRSTSTYWCLQIGLFIQKLFRSDWFIYLLFVFLWSLFVQSVYMWDSHSVSLGCSSGLRRPSSLTSYDFPWWAETILSPLDTRPPKRAMLATTPL